jgi:hypothetical protein
MEQDGWMGRIASSPFGRVCVCDGREKKRETEREISPHINYSIDDLIK